jgi:DNA-binding CsgD family transcriptional regulator
VLRPVARLGEDAGRLTRALAVLGGPASLQLTAALASLDTVPAARLADGLRAADVLAAGEALEFAHPILRSAAYEAIPQGERALAHAEAAGLLVRSGAGAERAGLHLLRSEPAGRPEAVDLLRAAAVAATGRGAPGAAAGYLRRALDEPAGPAVRLAVLLDLGVALTRERSTDAPAVLREAVGLAGTPQERGAAALLAARVLGAWGHHESVIVICREALGDGGLDPAAADRLEAKLFGSARISAATAKQAEARARSRLGNPPCNAWHIHAALRATVSGEPPAAALAVLAPVLESHFADVAPDSLLAVYAVLVLIWNDELATALDICDRVLADARSQGSMSMVARASCLRSMIMRRLGYLEEAAADGRVALEFRLATSPPLTVAWAAAFCVEALTRLGRLDEAAAIAATAADRNPPGGWIHTAAFLQARGELRLTQQRHAEALRDLTAAGECWHDLDIVNPAIASWRAGAAAACAALGRSPEAASLASEHLALARKRGSAATLGSALRGYAAAAVKNDGEETLAEAVRLLEATPARCELAFALTDLGGNLRRAGRSADARVPLRRALDLAQRIGSVPLADRARHELIAAGARPRHAAVTGPEALSGVERRVAALAAGGLSNRQIAEHLFITQATVETHLRHAFRKLGITSRADLTAGLSK